MVAVTRPKEEAEDADLAEDGGDERPKGCGGRGSIHSPTSTSSRSTATVFVAAWPRLVRWRAFIGAEAGGQRRRLGARAASCRQ